MKLPDSPMLKRYAVPWAAMLVLLGAELLTLALHLGPAAPLIGLVMAAIVVIGPMRLLEAPAQARIFALAGVFWLVVALLGLGSLDPLTRHDQPTFFRSEP